MSTIVTRAGKGSALTHTEMDANVTNLNSDKLESSNLKTINGSSIVGSGDLTISSSDVAANGYAYSNVNQYGRQTHSPGFNKGVWYANFGIPSSYTTAGYFNSGSFTTGSNSSGYLLRTIAIRIP